MSKDALTTRKSLISSKESLPVNSKSSGKLHPLLRDSVERLSKPKRKSFEETWLASSSATNQQDSRESLQGVTGNASELINGLVERAQDSQYSLTHLQSVEDTAVRNSLAIASSLIQNVLSNASVSSTGSLPQVLAKKSSSKSAIGNANLVLRESVTALAGKAAEVPPLLTKKSSEKSATQRADKLVRDSATVLTKSSSRKSVEVVPLAAKKSSGRSVIEQANKLLRDSVTALAQSGIKTVESLPGAPSDESTERLDAREADSILDGVLSEVQKMDSTNSVARVSHGKIESKKSLPREKSADKVPQTTDITSKKSLPPLPAPLKKSSDDIPKKKSLTQKVSSRESAGKLAKFLQESVHRLSQPKRDYSAERESSRQDLPSARQFQPAPLSDLSLNEKTQKRSTPSVPSIKPSAADASKPPTARSEPTVAAPKFATKEMQASSSKKKTAPKVPSVESFIPDTKNKIPLPAHRTHASAFKQTSVEERLLKSGLVVSDEATCFYKVDEDGTEQVPRSMLSSMRYSVPSQYDPPATGKEPVASSSSQNILIAPRTKKAPTSTVRSLKKPLVKKEPVKPVKAPLNIPKKVTSKTQSSQTKFKQAISHESNLSRQNPSNNSLEEEADNIVDEAVNEAELELDEERPEEPLPSLTDFYKEAEHNLAQMASEDEASDVLDRTASSSRRLSRSAVGHRSPASSISRRRHSVEGCAPLYMVPPVRPTRAAQGRVCGDCLYGYESDPNVYWDPTRALPSVGLGEPLIPPYRGNLEFDNRTGPAAQYKMDYNILLDAQAAKFLESPLVRKMLRHKNLINADCLVNIPLKEYSQWQRELSRLQRELFNSVRKRQELEGLFGELMNLVGGTGEEEDLFRDLAKAGKLDYDELQHFLMVRVMQKQEWLNSLRDERKRFIRTANHQHAVQMAQHRRQKLLWEYEEKEAIRRERYEAQQRAIKAERERQRQLQFERVNQRRLRQMRDDDLRRRVVQEKMLDKAQRRHDRYIEIQEESLPQELESPRYIVGQRPYRAPREPSDKFLDVIAQALKPMPPLRKGEKRGRGRLPPVMANEFKKPWDSRTMLDSPVPPRPLARMSMHRDDEEQGRVMQQTSSATSSGWSGSYDGEDDDLRTSEDVLDVPSYVSQPDEEPSDADLHEVPSLMDVPSYTMDPSHGKDHSHSASHHHGLHEEHDHDGHYISHVQPGQKGPSTEDLPTHSHHKDPSGHHISHIPHSSHSRHTTPRPTPRQRKKLKGHHTAHSQERDDPHGHYISHITPTHASPSRHDLHAVPGVMDVPSYVMDPSHGQDPSRAVSHYDVDEHGHYITHVTPGHHSPRRDLHSVPSLMDVPSRADLKSPSRVEATPTSKHLQPKPDDHYISHVGHAHRQGSPHQVHSVPSFTDIPSYIADPSHVQYPAHAEPDHDDHHISQLGHTAPHSTSRHHHDHSAKKPHAHTKQPLHEAYEDHHFIITDITPSHGRYRDQVLGLPSMVDSVEAPRHKSRHKRKEGHSPPRHGPEKDHSPQVKHGHDKQKGKHAQHGSDRPDHKPGHSPGSSDHYISHVLPAVHSPHHSNDRLTEDQSDINLNHLSPHKITITTPSVESHADQSGSPTPLLDAADALLRDILGEMSASNRGHITPQSSRSLHQVPSTSSSNRGFSSSAHHKPDIHEGLSEIITAGQHLHLHPHDHHIGHAKSDQNLHSNINHHAVKHAKSTSHLHHRKKSEEDGFLHPHHIPHVVPSSHSNHSLRPASSHVSGLSAASSTHDMAGALLDDLLDLYVEDHHEEPSHKSSARSHDRHSPHRQLPRDPNTQEHREAVELLESLLGQYTGEHPNAAKKPSPKEARSQQKLLKPEKTTLPRKTIWPKEKVDVGVSVHAVRSYGAYADFQEEPTSHVSHAVHGVHSSVSRSKDAEGAQPSPSFEIAEHLVRKITLGAEEEIERQEAEDIMDDVWEGVDDEDNEQEIREDHSAHSHIHPSHGQPHPHVISSSHSQLLLDNEEEVSSLSNYAMHQPESDLRLSEMTSQLPLGLSEMDIPDSASVRDFAEDVVEEALEDAEMREYPSKYSQLGLAPSYNDLEAASTETIRWPYNAPTEQPPLVPIESLLPGERKTPSGFSPLELSMSKILESHPHVLRGETERPLYGLPPPPRVWHGGNYDYDGGKKAGHEPQLVSRGPHVGPSHNMIEAIAQPTDEENRFSTPEGFDRAQNSIHSGSSRSPSPSGYDQPAAAQSPHYSLYSGSSRAPSPAQPDRPHYSLHSGSSRSPSPSPSAYDHEGPARTHIRPHYSVSSTSKKDFSTGVSTVDLQGQQRQESPAQSRQASPISSRQPSPTSSRQPSRQPSPAPSRAELLPEHRVDDSPSEEHWGTIPLVEVHPEQLTAKSPTQSPLQSGTPSPSTSPTRSPVQSRINSPGASPTHSSMPTPATSPTHSSIRTPVMSPSQSRTPSPTRRSSSSPSDSPPRSSGLSPSNSARSFTPSSALSPTHSPSRSPALSPKHSPKNSPAVLSPVESGHRLPYYSPSGIIRLNEEDLAALDESDSEVGLEAPEVRTAPSNEYIAHPTRRTKIQFSVDKTNVGDQTIRHYTRVDNHSPSRRDQDNDQPSSARSEEELPPSASVEDTRTHWQEHKNQTLESAAVNITPESVESLGQEERPSALAAEIIEAAESIQDYARPPSPSSSGGNEQVREPSPQPTPQPSPQRTPEHSPERSPRRRTNDYLASHDNEQIRKDSESMRGEIFKQHIVKAASSEELHKLRPTTSEEHHHASSNLHRSSSTSIHIHSVASEETNYRTSMRHVEPQVEAPPEAHSLSRPSSITTMDHHAGADVMDHLEQHLASTAISGMTEAPSALSVSLSAVESTESCDPDHPDSYKDPPPKTVVIEVTSVQSDTSQIIADYTNRRHQDPLGMLSPVPARSPVSSSEHSSSTGSSQQSGSSTGSATTHSELSVISNRSVYGTSTDSVSEVGSDTDASSYDNLSSLAPSSEGTSTTDRRTGRRSDEQSLPSSHPLESIPDQPSQETINYGSSPSRQSAVESTIESISLQDMHTSPLSMHLGQTPVSDRTALPDIPSVSEVETDRQSEQG